MIKSINKVDTSYTGNLVIDDETNKRITDNWNEFIKDKNPNDFFDGDIYAVTDIDYDAPKILISKTKYSSLVYAKKTNNLIVRSLFSAGYIKTSDDYICVILNNRGIINTIGGMASSEDFIDNVFDYNKCLIREFKEEIGIDLTNNEMFSFNLKYLKAPNINELNLSFYPVGTLFEINTKYTKDELTSLFNNSEHENEVKELMFFNKNNYKDIHTYDKKTEYIDELFDIIFK